MKDSRLTAKVKEFAYSIGADLVGIANIERFSNAPIMMSPQGILPTAKSVIVCAIHHPDACIELGGEPEPQNIGPYAVQYVMNDKLDMMSFKIARFLDDMGHKVIPIASSNIWRYRAYKDLDAVFAPDISHIYSAVAAGLSELGWHGLSMTPEYGTRNRFVSIITDAELEPDPLYDGEKLCDMCGECIRNCPTDAYRKECDGVKVLKIEDREYKFANKNLWRCAWGEHFDLDLNLKIPDVVNEKTIIKTVKKEGLRGGAFGSCLRYCLPKPLRYSDPEYTKINRRKRHFTPNDLEVHRGIIDKMITLALNYNLDMVGFVKDSSLSNTAIKLKKYMPDAESAIVLGMKFNIPKSGEIRQTVLSQYKPNAQFALNFTAYDIARELEKFGYSAIVQTSVDNDALAEICGFEKSNIEQGICTMYTTILTSAKFPEQKKVLTSDNTFTGVKEVTDIVKNAGFEAGADLIGISSVKRMNKVFEQTKSIKGDEELLTVIDKKPRFYQYDPIIKKKKRKLFAPKDYVQNAKSVIMLGLHFPEGVVERAGKPPAEAVGPYVFAQYEGLRLLGNIAFTVIKQLNNLGYNAVYSYNLLGLGSEIGSPRGLQHDNTCNSLEAVTAGIGELAYNGQVNTDEFGTNQRFIAIITDAALIQSDLKITGKTQDNCKNCLNCIKKCPVAALSESKIVKINIEGNEIEYLPVDTNRCNWSSKYALCGDDGFKYLGSKVNEMPPDVIDEKALHDALLKLDPIQKYRPATAECCITNCPLANKKTV